MCFVQFVIDHSYSLTWWTWNYPRVNASRSATGQSHQLAGLWSVPAKADKTPPAETGGVSCTAESRLPCHFKTKMGIFLFVSAIRCRRDELRLPTGSCQQRRRPVPPSTAGSSSDEM